MKWFKIVKKGDSNTFQGPGNRIEITIEIEEFFVDSNYRFIYNSMSGISTDTIHNFRINDSEQFANSEWGKKIFGKLIKNLIMGYGFTDHKQ